MQIKRFIKETWSHLVIFVTEHIRAYERRSLFRKLASTRTALAALPVHEAAAIREIELRAQRQILELQRGAKRLRINLEADAQLLEVELGMSTSRKVHNFRQEQAA